jgi:hypothetical protein
MTTIPTRTQELTTKTLNNLALQTGHWWKTRPQRLMGTWLSRSIEYLIFETVNMTVSPAEPDPRVTALARLSSCKIQTRPLVREDAPHSQCPKCLTNKDIFMNCRWVPDTKADWPNDPRSYRNFDICNDQLNAIGYDWAALFPEEINKGSWLSVFGNLQFETVKSGHEYRGTRAIERLRLWGPEVKLNYRRVFSSEVLQR